MRRVQAFTLLEILVALVVIAVVIAAVTPRIGILDNRRELDSVAHLKTSLEEALFEVQTAGTPLALQIGVDGYRFERQSLEGDWLPVEGSEVLAPQHLPDGLRVTRLVVDGNVRALPTRVELPTGAPPVMTLDLLRGTQTIHLRTGATGAVEQVDA